MLIESSLRLLVLDATMLVSQGHAELARGEGQASANNKNNQPSNTKDRANNPVLALEDKTSVCRGDLNANVKASLVFSIEEQQNERNLEKSRKEKQLVNDLHKNKGLALGNVNEEKLKLASELLKLGPTPPRPPRCLLEPQLCQNHSVQISSNLNNQLPNINISTRVKQLHNLLTGLPASSREESMWTLRRRRWVVLGLLATIIFVTAACLPFLVDRIRGHKNSSTPPSPFSHPLPRVPSLWAAQQSLPRPRQKLDAKLIGNPLLQELFLSVKTTERFHYPRLVVILETWGSLAKEQTWYFTDKSNSSTDFELERRSEGHLVRTDCPASHHRLSLCCKMEQVMTSCHSQKS